MLISVTPLYLTTQLWNHILSFFFISLFPTGWSLLYRKISRRILFREYFLKTIYPFQLRLFFYGFWKCLGHNRCCCTPCNIVPSILWNLILLIMHWLEILFLLSESLSSSFTLCCISFIPRKENGLADNLSKACLYHALITWA